MAKNSVVAHIGGTSSAVVPYRGISTARPKKVHALIQYGNNSNTESVLLRKIVNREKCLRSIMSSSLRTNGQLQRSILVPQVIVYTTNARDASTSARILSTVGKFLRIRYLILVGAIGGGVAAKEVSLSGARNPMISQK